MVATARLADGSMERSAIHCFGIFARRIGVRQEPGAENRVAAGLLDPMSRWRVAQTDARARAQSPGTSIRIGEPRR